ncbi:hypothetical protein [Ferruginibacter sp. SUN106]|uniref:hypothetical protein n=1 Tax=Ferruginibacter sp. SUN106 TaxID=2978348 RepID=UPI003D365B92
MKRLLSSVVIFAIVIIFFSACSKKPSTPDPVPVPQSFSTQLAKIYQVDSTLPAGKDTIFSQYYTYDNTNRLISQVEYIAKPNGDSFNVATIKFDYLGADTLAYRTFRKTTTTGSSPTTKTDTSYYNFLNGRYISDSIRYAGEAYSVASFSYASGKVTRYFHNFVYASSFSDTERSVMYQTLLNNNITRQIDTLVSTTNNPTPFANYDMTEFLQTYLPNPNPLFKIITPVHTDHIGNVGIGNYSNNKFAPKYLIAQQTINSKHWTTAGGSGNPITSSTINYDYTFRADGYPLMARITENFTGTVKKTKLVFVYQ